MSPWFPIPLPLFLRGVCKCMACAHESHAVYAPTASEPTAMPHEFPPLCKSLEFELQSGCRRGEQRDARPRRTTQSRTPRAASTHRTVCARVRLGGATSGRADGNEAAASTLHGGFGFCVRVPRTQNASSWRASCTTMAGHGSFGRAYRTDHATDNRPPRRNHMCGTSATLTLTQTRTRTRTRP